MNESIQSAAAFPSISREQFRAAIQAGIDAATQAATDSHPAARQHDLSFSDRSILLTYAENATICVRRQFQRETPDGDFIRCPLRATGIVLDTDPEWAFVDAFDKATHIIDPLTNREARIFTIYD